MRAWLYAMLAAVTLVAAPCLAQSGGQDGWADALFGTGGGAESVKAETADPPKKPEAPALLKGDKGDKGEAGHQGPQGPTGEPGRDGKNGKFGAIRTIRRNIHFHVAEEHGHLKGAGHKGVYRSIKDWHPASTGRVDTRDSQLSSRIMGETRMRQEADSAIRQEIVAQKNKEKKNVETLVAILAGLALLVGGVVAGVLLARNGGAGAQATATTTAPAAVAAQPPAPAATAEEVALTAEAARDELVLGLSGQDQRVADIRRTQCGNYRHETVRFYVGSPLVKTSGEAEMDVESEGSTIRRPVTPTLVPTAPAQQVTVVQEIRDLRKKIRKSLKAARQAESPAPAPKPNEEFIPADKSPTG